MANATSTSRKAKGSTTTRKAPTAAQKAEWDQARDEAVKAAHKTIADAVTAITTSDEWKAYLRFGAKFYRYSFSNVILMHVQAAQRGMEPLRRVAAFGAWKTLGHPVCKGERGLKIFAPIIVPVKEGEKGYVPTERRTRLVGFKITSVFDQQQVTDPDSIPTDPTAGTFEAEHTGEVSEANWAGLKSLITSAGYTFRFGATGKAEGYTDPDAKEIVIRSKYRGTVRGFSIALHEAAHMLLHTERDESGALVYDYASHRGMAETEAEGTAFVVATYLGIDVAGSSAGYIAGWSGGDTAAIVKAGTRIMATAKKIINAVADDTEGR